MLTILSQHFQIESFKRIFQHVRCFSDIVKLSNKKNYFYVSAMIIEAFQMNKTCLGHYPQFCDPPLLLFQGGDIFSQIINLITHPTPSTPDNVKTQMSKLHWLHLTCNFFFLFLAGKLCWTTQWVYKLPDTAIQSCKLMLHPPIVWVKGQRWKIYTFSFSSLKY